MSEAPNLPMPETAFRAAIQRRSRVGEDRWDDEWKDMM